MKSLSSCLLFFLLSNALFAQDTPSLTERAKAGEVMTLAQKGHTDKDPLLLLAATKLLLKNPQIRSASIRSVQYVKALQEEETQIPIYNYFDFYELMDYAQTYAMNKDKKTRRKVARLVKKLPEKLSPLGAEDDTPVVQYLSRWVFANNTAQITTPFDQKGKIHLTIEYGGALKLSVRDAKTQAEVGREESNKAVKALDFAIETPGNYEIVIENKSSKKIECLLQIEMEE